MLGSARHRWRRTLLVEEPVHVQTRVIANGRRHILSARRANCGLAATTASVNVRMRVVQCGRPNEDGMRSSGGPARRSRSLCGHAEQLRIKLAIG